VKYVKLENLTDNRLSFSGLRDGEGRPLRIEPRQVALVHPRVPDHPKVKGLLGTLVKVVKSGNEAKVKNKETAPIKEKPELNDKEKLPVKEKTVKEEDEKELTEYVPKELYLEAPGITEKNVDSVFGKFSNLKELASAKEKDLVGCGVQKSFAGRVIDWAKEQA